MTTRLILLSFCLILSTGCNPMTNLAMGAATVATYSVTGKGPADLAMSDYTGKDCDIRNPKKYDGQYCVSHLPEDGIRGGEVYCHRTLGVPDCSASPDPYANKNQPIVGTMYGHRGAVDLTAGHSGYVPPPIPRKDSAANPVALTPAQKQTQPKKAGSEKLK
jgi:hypothetical protein